jgi:transcriptional regulator with XRE-family HTH domain
MPWFINSTMKRIWKRMGRKAWRTSYVGAHISNTIASQITKLRLANGWTQARLADQVGMKQSRISALEDPNWENVEVATLRRLAAAFDVALTVRFVPFSHLAEWVATLSDDKLLVPSYEEEAREPTVSQPLTTGAAAAFLILPEQRSAKRAEEMRGIHAGSILPSIQLAAVIPDQAALA